MALNPNIILQGKTATFEQPDPIAQYSKGLQLKGLMQQQTLQDQAMADDQATRSAYQSGGGDTSAVLKSLMQGGNYKAAAALQKQIDDQAKSKADIGFTQARTGKTLDDVQISKIAQHRDELSNVNSLDSAMAWAKQGLDQGLYPGGQVQYEAGLKQIQEAFRDPILAQQWKQQAALGATNYIKENAPKYQTNNLGGKTVTMALPGLGGAPTIVSSQANSQSPDSAASTAVQMRGQNMTDARMRESNTQTFSKPFEVTGPNGTPVLVRQDGQGNVTPVEGFGPKTGTQKALTDSQAKAALFGTRMDASGKILDELSSQGINKSIPGSRLPYGVGEVINAVSPSDFQKLDQAKRDFINAALRRESGAAIAQSEFDNAEKQYFPQPGDKKAVIEQKRQNRALATRGILAEIPGNQREDLVNQITGNQGGQNVSAPKTFNSLPDPASLNGKRIQAPDGSIMRSNGSKWIQEK